MREKKMNGETERGKGWKSNAVYLKGIQFYFIEWSEREIWQKNGILPINCIMLLSMTIIAETPDISGDYPSMLNHKHIYIFTHTCTHTHTQRHT